MRVIVFEDALLNRLGSLTQTRPVFLLRCGAVSLLDRVLRCFAAEQADVVVRPEMAALTRFLLPGVPVNEPVSGDVLLVNGRWLAPENPPGDWESPGIGRVGDQLAYARLTVSGEWRQADLAWQVQNVRDLPTRAAGGVMIDRPWDLVENNGNALRADGRHWRTHREARTPAGWTVIGPAEDVLVHSSARIEPFAILDTTNGPVMIDERVHVQAFSRLDGPCYIGPDTQVLAGRVKGASIGPQCRIGGEVEHSIVHGHTNKAHEGFLGHSYLGEWVNFGAGTQTSDLRNDYEKVPVTVNGSKVETGLLKVGSFVGDHTKTSINTLFNTGTMVGPFSMLVTSGSLLPRSLPAFCQMANGRLTERTDVGQMFTTARTMMARRKVEWTADHEDFFLDLYERTSRERLQRVSEGEQRRLKRVI